MKPEPAETLYLSVVTYLDGKFDVIMKDGSGQEVTLSGTQKVTKEEFALLDTWAPACVWTKYKRETPFEQPHPLARA